MEVDRLIGRSRLKSRAVATLGMVADVAKSHVSVIADLALGAYGRVSLDFNQIYSDWSGAL